MKLLNLLLLPAMLLIPNVVFSANEEIEALKKNLAEHIPSANIVHVKTTPIDGLYEVMVDAEIYYMNVGARYIVKGEITDLATRRNITKETMSGYRKEKIEKFGEANMVVYAPKEVAHTITVITDIDCTYCRRLHSEMDEYMKGNVKVRYIFMPIRGASDFENTVSVWCSKDRKRALDLAKSGGDVVKASCDNPISEHLAFSRGLGVQGTPAIILENGEMLGGYVPANKLIPELSRINSVSAK